MSSDIQLDMLEAKGLIKLAVARPELEYLFRHALVQDAAYTSLLKQERRDLHGRVGEALEQLYPDRREELAPVLAMHFEQAGETSKALDYFVTGGHHALEQNAITEAYHAYERARALMPAADPRDDDATQRQRIEIALGRARSGYSFIPPEVAVASLEAIVDEAERLGDPEVIGRLHTYIALGRLQLGESFEKPALKRSLDRIAEIGEQIGDPSLRALPLALVGLSNTFTGNLRRGVAALEEAVPLLEERNESIGAAFARGALAIGYAQLGEFEKAEAAAGHAVEIAAQGDLIAQLDALIASSMVKSMKGELDQAVPLARECVERSEATGASACAVVSSWILGDVFHRQGRFSEAKDVLERGAEISLVLDRRVWRPTLQAWLRSSAAALGEVDDENFDTVLETARSIGNTLGEAGILAKRAETEARRGDVDAAVADFEACAALLEAQGARPILARILRSWGEILRTAGRMEAADAILGRSLALFEELRLEPEAAGVRTLRALGGATVRFD
jgi:tetratricopeptide (TPR) repeat protein